ncbi:cation:proton antiporter [Nodularia sphaerocarpa]|uniref:cation:proton antiporter domain-containing protein n=1 Tax=Nodularia sphaerocarpa TaxID=137816 RepID=UPI001EFB22C5|nr:cation:proton antiporter [Nodularia sphaerocarpa]MDB9375086.1 cation:proton antiporter [Nodularia sphaerocarpa CS-585]MDB9379068.1 cation:proton antiporter [Nodularia sphaerocarpa CS-585A2]ULP73301.1 Na(+)/H(+)-K(+) antiporter GerN [Nodularia sphaerocarpa UHCC 0038]
MELLSQVLALEPTSQVLGEEAIVSFAVLLVVILVIPILFERLRLPALIGLVFSGVVLGPSGWDLFHAESPIIRLLSDIGLFYLMFVAGLEVEVKHFVRQKRSWGFGILTFSFPLVIGTLIGQFFHWQWNAAILIGSLLANYTLLAYPILSRLGVLNNQAVTITMKATVFTNLSAVLVLAVCVATTDTEPFSFAQLLPLLIWLSVYTMTILVGFDWAGKELFRRFGDDEGNKFLFVLLTVFLAAVGAQFIGIETIVGAFLAGLVVNQAVGEGPVKEKLVFIGSVLFIPIFLVNFGSIIDLPALITSIDNWQLTFLIVVGLISSKFIAALLTKLLYRYNWGEMLTIWSLSIPQMGTTLAATFVGYRAGLFPQSVLNSVFVLMLVTSILGLWITSQTARGLVSTAVTQADPPTLFEQNSEAKHSPVTIVVPVYNPQTQQYLLEMAALLANITQGKIVPLAIATAAAQMDAPQLEIVLRRSERLLAKATAQSRLLGVEAEPLLRIDDAFALGISRAAREQKASLIIMGWGKRTGLRARLFGNVIDSVLWASHCPVAVTRLMDSPKKIQRILVPLENLTASSLQPVKFAQMLAEANQAQVTVLHVCMGEARGSEKIASKRSHLALLMSQLAVPHPPEIQIIAHENAAQAILQAARLYDLVVLPFIRNRTSPGGLTMSDVTTQLAGQLTCSIVMLGEAQHTQLQMSIPEISHSTTAI